MSILDLRDQPKLCARCRAVVGPAHEWWNHDFCERCLHDNYTTRKAVILLGGPGPHNALVEEYAAEVAAYRRGLMEEAQAARRKAKSPTPRRSEAHATAPPKQRG